MPVASESTVQGAIGKACIADKELAAYLATTGTHWVTREAAFLAAVPSGCAPAVQNQQREQRSKLAEATFMLQGRIDELIAEYGRAVLLPPGVNRYDRLFRYFGDNSKTVLSRGFSFGSWSAGGSNVGTGLVRRLTVDEYGFVIENGFAEVKTAECVADSNSGRKRHSELFEYRGKPPGIDALELIGSGKNVRIECMSADSTQRLGVKNPSFEGVTGSTGSLTEIHNWTPSAIGSFDTITSAYYRDVPGVATPRSLKIAGNASIKQTFADMRVNWEPGVPIYAQIAYNREVGSGDGNLNIVIGSKTATVALSAQTGWNILTFLITTDAWPKNWNAVGADPATNGITISIDSRTTGYTLVDDLIVGPYVQVDGAWVAIIGGATPFVRRDVFTATDTSTDTGIIQTQFAKQLGFYLPHTTPTPTWSEPT